MTYRTLHLELTGEIAMITLSRPEKRNAISPEMIEEILAALGEVEARPARVFHRFGVPEKWIPQPAENRCALPGIQIVPRAQPP